MVELRECIDGIDCGVENQLRPLRPSRVWQRNHAQSGTIQQYRQPFNASIGSACGLEGPDPEVTVVFKPHMAWPDQVRRHRGRTTDYVPDMFGNDLLVPQSVLYGTHGAGAAKNVRRMLDGVARVHALSRKDAKIARRNFASL